jgi:Ca2+-binding RTX toxin-like protein
VTGNGATRSTGGPGNDTIVTGDGPDEVDGGTGNDTITTGKGNDGQVLGVIGGDGDDTIDTGDGHDSVTGGKGNDTITTGKGNDLVVAGDGADTVDLGDGDDVAHTNAFIVGTSPDGDVDHVIGGLGNDQAWGGCGDQDAFIEGTDLAQALAWVVPGVPNAPDWDVTWYMDSYTAPDNATGFGVEGLGGVGQLCP